MKNSIFKGLLACGSIMLMAGCSENSWNEDHLDGFDSETLGKPSGTTTAEYTLSSTDFSAISSNATNVALAKEAGVSSLLKDLATTECFSTALPAKTYLPAWMESSSFPYFLTNDGSVVELTYNQTNGGTPVYTVSANDYQKVYGSDVDFVEAFAPAHLPGNFIPGFLSDQYADATEGDEVIVNYAYTDEEPNFGEKWEMSNVLGSVSLNDQVTVNGIVSGICGQGFVLTDKGGSILCYQGKTYDVNAVKPGNKVKISGKVGAYNKGFQLSLTADNFSVMGADEFTFPTPTEITGADMDAAIKRSNNALGQYVKFTAKASVSDNYYNFFVDGAETAQGSGYQLTTDQKKAFKDGDTYTIEGWFLSISNSAGAPKFYNFIPVKVNGKMIIAMAPPAAGVQAEKMVNVYTLNNGTWAPASNVTTLTAADYASMGVTENKLEEPGFYLPIFLKSKLPYATAGTTHYVIYNKTKVATVLYNGTDWTVNNDGFTSITTQWKKVEGKWQFVKIVGVATFNYVSDAQLLLDHKYLMVAEGICATPLDASKNYGYLYTDVVPNGMTLVLANDQNAFEFTTSYVSGDTKIDLPEGKFLIKDNSGRYLYMDGTYNSFSATDKPLVDGAVNPSAMFTATANGDGSWKISTEIGGSTKWIQYSTNYTSWGCYPSVSGIDPMLYMLAE